MRYWFDRDGRRTGATFCAQAGVTDGTNDAGFRAQFRMLFGRLRWSRGQGPWITCITAGVWVQQTSIPDPSVRP